MTPTHGFVYAASRRGKTTFASSFAKAGQALMAVTREPGPTQAGLLAAGVDNCPIFVPKTPEELFTFLEYTEPFLALHFDGYKPGAILFDNLQGLQQLIVGSPAEPEREIAGLKIPKQEATGIMRIPIKRAEAESGQPAQMDYGILGRFTRRFLSLVDSLPYHTLITATESLEFDEKYKKDTQGMSQQAAAGRTRKIKGYPATEGFMIKPVLPSLVAGYYLHLTKRGDKFIIHTQPHVDAEGVEWFADPRGLRTQAKEIDWTNKSAWDILQLGG